MRQQFGNFREKWVAQNRSDFFVAAAALVPDQLTYLYAQSRC